MFWSGHLLSYLHVGFFKPCKILILEVLCFTYLDFLISFPYNKTQEAEGGTEQTQDKEEEKKAEEEEAEKKQEQEEDAVDGEKKGTEGQKEGEAGAEGEEGEGGEAKKKNKEEEEETIPQDFYYNFGDHASKAVVAQDSGLPLDMLSMQ